MSKTPETPNQLVLLAIGPYGDPDMLRRESYLSNDDVYPSHTAADALKFLETHRRLHPEAPTAINTIIVDVQRFGRRIEQRLNGLVNLRMITPDVPIIAYSSKRTGHLTLLHYHGFVDAIIKEASPTIDDIRSVHTNALMTLSSRQMRRALAA